MPGKTFILPGLFLICIATGSAFGASLNGIPLGELAVQKELQRNFDGHQAMVLEVDLDGLVRKTGGRLAEHFRKTGLDYLGPLGKDGVLLFGPAGGGKKLGATPLSPGDKIAQDVRTALLNKRDDEISLLVLAAGDGIASSQLPGATVTQVAVKGRFSRTGLRVAGSDLASLVMELANQPEVFSIQRASGARMLNSTARRVVQSGTTDTGGETVWERGLRGEGQVLAILDTGAAPLSCYLAEPDATLPPVVRGTAHTMGDFSRRKIVVYDMLYSEDDPSMGLIAYENQGHGTYVSGNAAGSKYDDPFSTNTLVYTGVAPAAKLVVQDAGFRQPDDCADLIALGCPLVDLTPFLEQAYAQGARLHNNSWGDRENFDPHNTYTATSEDMDDMVWRNPDFLICCAAGNDGATFGLDSVASPSTAKNVISAAATDNPSFNQITSFSSIGWTDDGRIKPDLAAPGVTYTAKWGDTVQGQIYCFDRRVAGTSMASPITMGSAALVRQYFTEGWYPTGAPKQDDATTPSAALLKAVLINGAAQVVSEPAPPSRKQGWGRVLLEDSLSFEGESRRLFVADEWAAFPDSSEPPREFAIDCNATAFGDLRVTMAYTDYPAIPGVIPQLVNDLDLEVETQGGDVYLGNNFDSESGYSVLMGEADVLNNVEVVRLPAEPGSYTIRIRPRTIVEATQGFALAVSWEESTTQSSVDGLWMLY